MLFCGVPNGIRRPRSMSEPIDDRRETRSWTRSFPTVPPVSDGGAEKPRPENSQTSQRSVGELKAALVVAAAAGDTAELRRLADELERLEGVALPLRVVK